MLSRDILFEYSYKDYRSAETHVETAFLRIYEVIMIGLNAVHCGTIHYNNISAHSCCLSLHRLLLW